MSAVSLDSALSGSHLTKRYGTGDAVVIALDDVSVHFPPGSFTAIMGQSGSGKSTLLHLLSGLDTADSGSVAIGNTALDRLDDHALTLLRRQHVGFVFQSFNLVPTLTAEQNIALPSLLAGTPIDRDVVMTVATQLGLSQRLSHLPSELSGGQQQRVAVARALVSQPPVVFADEPTGNLDSHAGAEVLRLLHVGTRERGQTVVVVTHDPVVAATADRVLMLADGKLRGELAGESASAIAYALTEIAK